MNATAGGTSGISGPVNFDMKAETLSRFDSGASSLLVLKMNYRGHLYQLTITAEPNQAPLYYIGDRLLSPQQIGELGNLGVSKSPFLGPRFTSVN